VEECCICFGELHKQPIVALFEDSLTRSCSHLLHDECIRLLQRRRCPLCNMDFEMTKALPDPRENPRAWYDIVDANDDGSLTYKEVTDVLRAQLPLDLTTLDAQMEILWSRWTGSSSGRITYDRLVGEDGLLEYVKYNFPLRVDAKPPDIVTDKIGFFSFWDRPENGGNGSGELDTHEIVRAFVKTFANSSLNAHEMRTIIEMIIDEYDDNGDKKICMEEFLRPDGLGAMIIANLNIS